MDDRHEREHPAGGATRRDGEKGQVVPFPPRPRPRPAPAATFGEAWYHQAAIEEAAKHPLSPR